MLIEKPGDALSAIRSAKAHLQVGSKLCFVLVSRCVVLLSHVWHGGLKYLVQHVIPTRAMRNG
jgi:hypothetical protein